VDETPELHIIPSRLLAGENAILNSRIDIHGGINIHGSVLFIPLKLKEFTGIIGMQEPGIELED